MVRGFPPNPILGHQKQKNLFLLFVSTATSDLAPSPLRSGHHHSPPAVLLTIAPQIHAQCPQKYGPKTVRAPARYLPEPQATDRKSTRLNSSHLGISYAVFCLRKT